MHVVSSLQHVTHLKLSQIQLNFFIQNTISSSNSRKRSGTLLGFRSIGLVRWLHTHIGKDKRSRSKTTTTSTPPITPTLTSHTLKANSTQNIADQESESSVHQTDVIQTMKDMINQLKIQEKQIKSYNNYVQSYKTALDINHNMANELTTQIKQSEQEITRKIKNGLHEKGKEREFYENSQVLNLTEVTNYQRLLNDHLKNNQLIDEETLLTIKNSLDSNKKRPLTAPSDPKLKLGKIYREKLSQFPFDMDTTNSFDNTTDQKQGNKKLFVTVSLTTIKEFQSPLLRTFSVGNLPSVISLPQKYFEYFFVRKGNSLLLKSTTSIDLYNRGSGLELAIRTKIQDRLLAADWCEKSQKLILIGNHNLYEFDMDRRIKPKKYSCEPVQGDPLCWPRFVRCMNRFIFYAYKADAQSYILEKHDLTRSNNINLVPLKSVNVNGNIRCMCVTYSFIAIVTRREKKPEQLSLISKNNNNIEQFEHVLCVYDHTLQEKKTEKLPNLKWVTGICSLGENKY
ncbi:unnamed protein product, partial [Didymodactylos carnosus]